MHRRAQLDDAGRIAEIHVFGWRCAYRGIVTDDVLFGKMRVAASAERWRKSLTAEAETAAGAGETWVVETDGIIRAFMTMGDTRDPDRDGTSFELWGIYVDPAFLRSGFGGGLIELCEDEARRRGRKEVLVWVFERNPGARAFYEKHGFRAEGKTQVIENLGAVEMRYVKPLGKAMGGQENVR